MVGVTSPLFRHGDIRGGLALAGWYVVGTALAGAVVFGAVTVVSVGVSALPSETRYLVVAPCLVVLLVLDLLGRTPRVDRQTFQRLSHLPPAVRGFVWGVDIGLLFTTIKVTSLVWVVLLLSAADPGHALLAVGVFYGAYLAAEAVAVALDLGLGPARVFSALQRPGFRLSARFVSAVVLVPVIAAAVSRVF